MKYEDLDLAFITIWLKDGDNVIIYIASCEKSQISNSIIQIIILKKIIIKKDVNASK